MSKETELLNEFIRGMKKLGYEIEYKISEGISVLRRQIDIEITFIENFEKIQSSRGDIIYRDRIDWSDLDE